VAALLTEQSHQQLKDLLYWTPVPEFIEPVLGLKTSVFIKTSLKCSFSIKTLLRDDISSLF
jgi:hypothetical protein